MVFSFASANQGHWGFELALDATRANIADGAFVRTSYPFTFAPMLYLFQNRPDRHFNIYATAGFGLMASDIALYQGSRQERNQQFWKCSVRRAVVWSFALPDWLCFRICARSERCSIRAASPASSTMA